MSKSDGKDSINADLLEILAACDQYLAATPPNKEKKLKKLKKRIAKVKHLPLVNETTRVKTGPI